MTSLATKYRPQDFDQFKGSELVSSMLQKMVATESVPPCLLFTGIRGTGKTSMARILSNQLNKGEQSNLSYIEVDAASNSGVEHVRTLQESLKYSHAGEWRVVVLDEAHALSKSAFNALLKILEEPPARTVFILVTTQPESIPDTVRSRASQFRFQPIPAKTIAYRLAEIVVAEKLPIREASILNRISEVVEGSMRGAIFLLQQLLLVESPTVKHVNFLSGYTVSTKDLLYSMLSGNLSELEVEVSVIFNEICDVEKMLHTLVADLKEFHAANMINNSQFLSCMQTVWNMRKIQGGNDLVARTQLEAGLFAMFAQNFWNGDEGDAVVSAAKLSAEDLNSI